MEAAIDTSTLEDTPALETDTPALESESEPEGEPAFRRGAAKGHRFFGGGGRPGMPHRSPLTREEKTAIRKLSAKGVRGAEIAKRFNININSYYNFKSRLNKQLGLHNIDKEALFSDRPRLIFRTQIAEPQPRRGRRGSAKQTPLVASLADVEAKRVALDTGEAIPLGIRETVPSLKEWVEKNAIILDGEPLTFRKHEYLIEPYTEDHPFTVNEKATQMCITSMEMCRVIHRARFRKYRNILYYFPSKTDVIDFSRTRIAPLIEENPDTIGNWIQETNNTTVKRLWNTFLLFRGMNSAIGVKSAPGDYIIFDELDEATEDRMAMALKRLSHSQFKEIAMLSNPTLPDYGINKQFQRSDMRYWLLKCPKCNKYTCMEDTFPECIVEWDGGVVRLCQSCRDAELNPSVGEWVAKRPAITNIRGRHYSQLWSWFVSPQEILDEYNTTSNIKQFYNLTIGSAFVEAENRLTVREVLDLCRDDGIADSDPGPCTMGVDQMSHSLHVTIGKRVLEKAGKIVHIGIYKDWSELNTLMEKFHVNRCVCDLQPETRNARAFATKHKGRVFLNFYRERQKGDYIWDEEKMMVLCNRTESLDASHYEVQEGNITFPKDCDLMKKFAEQLHNAGKELIEEKDKDGKPTGAKRYVYKKLGEDHFRHSFNYECMARQYQVDLLFPELL